MVSINFGEAFVAIRASFDDFDRDLRGASARIQRGLGSIQEGATRAGRGLTRNVTLPLIGVGTAATTVAVRFDTEMRKITSLVGIAADEVDAMGKGVRDIAKETGRGPEELASALFAVTSAGARGETAMEALRAAAQGAAAGLGETRDVALAAVSAVNVYGESNLSATQAVSVLANTVKEGNLEASELAAVMGRAVPFAKVLGVSLDQVGGALASLTQGGLGTSEAVTSLNGIMRAFIKPTEDARKALLELAQVNEDLPPTFELLRAEIDERGLFAVLVDLKEAVGDDVEAFGRLIPEATGLAGALSITGANAEKNAAIFKRMGETVESDLTDKYKAAEGPALAFQRAMVALQDAGIELGNVLIPIVVPAVQAFTEAVVTATKAFAALPPGTQDMILAVGGLAVAIGPLLLAIGGIAGATRLAIGGLASFGGAAAATGATATAASVGVGKLTLAIRALGRAFVAFAIIDVLFETNNLLKELNRTTEEGVSGWTLMGRQAKAVLQNIRDDTLKTVGVLALLVPGTGGGSLTQLGRTGIFDVTDQVGREAAAEAVQMRQDRLARLDRREQFNTGIQTGMNPFGSLTEAVAPDLLPSGERDLSAGQGVRSLAPTAESIARRDAIAAQKKELKDAADAAKAYGDALRAALAESSSTSSSTTQAAGTFRELTQSMRDNVEALEAQADGRILLAQSMREEAEIRETIAQLQGQLGRDLNDEEKQDIRDLIELRNQHNAAIKANQAALREAEAQAKKTAEETKSAFADLGETVTRNLESAGDTMFRVFKDGGDIAEAFRDTIFDVVQDVLKELAKLAAAQVFGSGQTTGGGNFFGGVLSGLSSFVGGLFGGGGGISIPSSPIGNPINAGGGAFKQFAFADGGRMTAGQLGLVGERGPELFVPDVAGTVVPNDVFGGVGAQLVQNNTFSVGMEAAVRAEIKNLLPMIADFTRNKVTEDIQNFSSFGKTLQGG